MLSCESTQSWKVPFKACQNTVIPHNLVTIRLGVEWPARGGDDPNLVIYITDKNPPAPYFQQNPPSSSVVVNSVHHHQQQESFGSAYQQNYYHHHQHHHSSAMNNHEPLNSTTTMTNTDQNDASLTTTTTVVYNSMPPKPQPQSQASTSPSMNQQGKNESKPQLSPIMYRRQQTPNQPFLPPQHVIQAPPINMNDSRLNMQMPTISSTSSINLMPTVTTHYVDLQPAATMTYPPPPTMTNSPMKSLICSCSNPPNVHEHNCPVINLTKQQSNTILSHEPTYRPTNDQQTVFAAQPRLNGTMSIPPMNKPLITTISAPFHNPNLMKPSGPSASVTTIISQQQQQQQFPNYNQISPTIKMPSLDAGNNFQQQTPFNFSQVIINNPQNYQSNPSLPKPPIVQQTITPKNSRKSKKSPTKPLHIPNPDQTSFQNPNDSQQQQQNHSLSNQSSPVKTPNNNPPSTLSSPIQLQQGNYIQQDNSRISANLSSDNTSCGSTNDTNGSIPQQQNSPNANKMIRSPVRLDFPVRSNPIPAPPGTPEIEQIISDVARGVGNIISNNTSISTGEQQQQLLPRPASNTNGSVVTTPHLTPIRRKPQPPSYSPNTQTLPNQNFVNITRELVPPSIHQSTVDTLLQQQAPDNNNKRNRSDSKKTTVSKRPRKTLANGPRLTTTTTSSSYTKLLQAIPMSSPITPTSNSRNKPHSWTDINISSSSLNCVSTTAPLPHIDTLSSHRLTDDLWHTLDGDHHDPMSNGFLSNNEQGPMDFPSVYDFDLEELFSSKTDDRFNSSTPPLPSSALPPALIQMPIISQILTPASAERSSTTSTALVTASDEIYQEFLSQSHMYSSASTWQENQVSSTVLTPPDPPNNNLPQQPHHSQIHECFDSDSQSQTPTSQVPKTNSKPMNDNDDVQTSSKKQEQPKSKPKPLRKPTHPLNSTNNKSSKNSSKVSKQPNRSNPTPKQPSTKFTCTRCGLTRLLDITHHEFPKQKGLVFECLSCGNNSIRSNVSPDERQRRLAKVAADHLNTVECQFCHKTFHSHNDYLKHLKDDHNSNKPM